MTRYDILHGRKPTVRDNYASIFHDDREAWDFQTGKRTKEKYFNLSPNEYKERIIAEYIRTAAGRARLAASMVQPLRLRRDFSRFSQSFKLIRNFSQMMFTPYIPLQVSQVIPGLT